MEEIKKGNDIEITWKFYTESNGSKYPYSLINSNLSLYISGENFRRRKVDNFTRTTNSVKWVYYGKDQTDLGVYALELIINEGMQGMVSIDKCDAFILTNHYCNSEDTENGGVGLTSLLFESIIIDKNSSSTTPSDPPMPIVIDSELSLESTNPVQNKVITAEIEELKNELDNKVNYEVVEAFVPLSRDFSDDFNNDFTR